MRLKANFDHHITAAMRPPSNLYFDWRRFVDLHNIPYVTRGPNTARGHISIRCPMCTDDTSEHMGLCLNPRNPVWGCFRNPEHRGKSPHRLLMALLKCSWDFADRLVTSTRPEFDDFERMAVEFLHSAPDEPDVQQAPQRKLEFPSQFKALTNSARGGYGKHFFDYLRGRGLEPATLCAIRFKMHYALTGSFKWRLIIPFYHHGELVGWTGRAIGNKANLRYLTLPSDAEGAERLGSPPALTRADEYVFKQDAVQGGGDVLVIEEGPLDAVKTEWYRPDPGFVITCVFGMPKAPQIQLLANAARRYSRVFVILDRGVLGVSNKMAVEIEEISGTKTVVIEPGQKDPGAMNADEISDMLEGGLR